jgi:hypothetical protein
MERYGSIEEIGAKMDALAIWEEIAPFNFAVKPKGTVFPYFCTALKGDGELVKIRFLMLEGWQTLHDFVRVRIDSDFGFYSSPMEMPHLEMVITRGGEIKLFRHDAGYMPLEANEAQRSLASKILWEAYGVMMRVESDRMLPLKFSGDKAVFARVENPAGQWRDEPLVIPPPPPYTETVKLPKSDVAAAKDLPFVAAEAIELDMRMLPGVMTKEARPRTVYELSAYDVSGVKIIESRASVDPRAGLKALWEMLAPEVLRALVKRGVVPGEIKVVSGRVFRFLRPLCMELPFKLSLHDKLQHFSKS